MPCTKLHMVVMSAQFATWPPRWSHCSTALTMMDRPWYIGLPIEDMLMCCGSSLTISSWTPLLVARCVLSCSACILMSSRLSNKYVMQFHNSWLCCIYIHMWRCRYVANHWSEGWAGRAMLVYSTTFTGVSRQSILFQVRTPCKILSAPPAPLELPAIDSFCCIEEGHQRQLPGSRIFLSLLQVN